MLFYDCCCQVACFVYSTHHRSKLLQSLPVHEYAIGPFVMWSSAKVGIHSRKGWTLTNDFNFFSFAAKGGPHLLTVRWMHLISHFRRWPSTSSPSVTPMTEKSWIDADMVILQVWGTFIEGKMQLRKGNWQDMLSRKIAWHAISAQGYWVVI